jgi:hypothetical protein
MSEPFVFLWGFLVFGSLLGLEPFSLLISYFIWAFFKSSANLHLLAEKGREREICRETDWAELALPWNWIDKAWSKGNYQVACIVHGVVHNTTFFTLAASSLLVVEEGFHKFQDNNRYSLPFPFVINLKLGC